MVEKAYEIVKGISLKFEFDKLDLNSLEEVEAMARAGRKLIESVKKEFGTNVTTVARTRSVIGTETLKAFLASKGGSATNEEIMKNFNCKKSDYSGPYYYLKEKGILRFVDNKIELV